MLFDLRGIGVDLRDLWRAGSDVTPRYVLWLVGQLPPDSAFNASLRGGSKYRAWTLETQLLAGAVNMLYGANMQRAGKKVKAMPVNPPKPSAKSQRSGRVQRIANLPSARRVAGR